MYFLNYNFNLFENFPVQNKRDSNIYDATTSHNSGSKLSYFPLCIRLLSTYQPFVIIKQLFKKLWQKEFFPCSKSLYFSVRI